MAKTKGPTVLIKKKRWVPIIAPAMFNEREIGEIHVAEPKDAVGRKVSVSLMILTGDPQKQSFQVQFLVKDAVGEKLSTEILGWELLPSAARKLMRRNKSKIEDSFIVKTADEKTIRIKPIMVTRGRAKGGVVTALRHGLRDGIEKAAVKLSYEQLIKEFVMKKFQRSIADGLKKTYPIGIIEIRMFKLIEEKK